MQVPGIENVQEKTRQYCQVGPLDALLYDLSRSGKQTILWYLTTQCDHVIEARRSKRRVKRQLLWILLHRGISECMKRSVKRLISKRLEEADWKTIGYQTAVSC